MWATTALLLMVVGAILTVYGDAPKLLSITILIIGFVLMLWVLLNINTPYELYAGRRD
jgi:uncharacterized membrane protein